jgi:hypothetical protein
MGFEEKIPKGVDELRKEVGGDGMDHTGEIDHRTLMEEGIRIVDEVEHDWEIVAVSEALLE